MTEAEFIERFRRKVKRMGAKFELRGNALRLADPAEDVCPLEFDWPGEFMKRARQAGLPTHSIRRIMLAADTTLDFVSVLRAKLLDAAGVSQ